MQPLRDIAIWVLVLLVCGCATSSKRHPALVRPAFADDARGAASPAAVGAFRVELGLPAGEDRLEPDSPFGINTALSPNAPDLDKHLSAMQQAGIKWGRQDFTWRKIETTPGQYDWAPYDRLVAECRRHGILLVGDLAYAPSFHDPRTPQGVAAYAQFTRAAAEHFRGRVDYWQIWNEPNGGYWKGSPEQYAALLTAAGQAIHQANPSARVLGLNMAFCDIIWAEKILRLVPYDGFDIVCFHPYRPPSAPEESFDWWEHDQYVKSWHKRDLTADYPLVHETFLQQTDELIAVMKKFGKPKPLWVTEICWNTHIHPYGTGELRQADLLVRFYLQAIASRKIEKVFWWTLSDTGTRQFDQTDMVGLMRKDLEPKYSFYAFAQMTRMLEGKAWVRNDAWGPDVYVAVFTDARLKQDTLVAWSPRPYAYVRVNNEAGLTFHDVFGTRRTVPVDPVRTRSLPVPLGESPIYITGAYGLKAAVRPDPGW